MLNSVKPQKSEYVPLRVNSHDKIQENKTRKK